MLFRSGGLAVGAVAVWLWCRGAEVHGRGRVVPWRKLGRGGRPGGLYARSGGAGHARARCAGGGFGVLRAAVRV